jgi:hypothetical protein
VHPDREVLVRRAEARHLKGDRDRAPVGADRDGSDRELEVVLDPRREADRRKLAFGEQFGDDVVTTMS